MTKIVDLFKELLDKIKGLWNVYGGIAISSLIAWLTNWNKVEMDKWSSYLILTITCISLLTFFKVIFKKKTNGVPDTIALNQNKSVKNLKTALYPEKTGEELGNAIIYTVKGGKKIMGKFSRFMKWLWGNKYTLISIISNLIVSAAAQFVMYSDTLKDYAFFQEHKIVFIVVVTALCVLWLIDNIFCVVTKYGLENLNEIKARVEAKTQEKLNKLKPEQKKVLKNILGGLKEKKVAIVEQLKNVDETYVALQKEVEQFEMLKNINYSFTQEELLTNQTKVNELNQAYSKKSALENQKAKIENDIQNIKKQL